MAISKEYIVEYSTDLFIKNGFRSIRMDDISNGLGISKRTLYEIFADKESLIYECLNLHIKRKLEQIKKSEYRDNILIELLKHANNSESFRDKEVFTNELHKYYPEHFKKFVKKHIAVVQEYLLREFDIIRKQGYIIEDVDLKIVILMLQDSFQMIDQYLNQNFELDREGMRNSIRNLIYYVLRGISTPKGQKLIDEYIENQKNKN